MIRATDHLDPGDFFMAPRGITVWNDGCLDSHVPGPAYCLLLEEPTTWWIRIALSDGRVFYAEREKMTNWTLVTRRTR